MLCNRIDTEAKKMVELPEGSPGCRVEIKAMDQSIFFLKTQDHEGPIKLSIEFTARCEGDVMVLIDKEKDKLEEGECEWTYRDKLVMNLIPKRVADKSQQTNKAK
jgi:hypothetical protein